MVDIWALFSFAGFLAAVLASISLWTPRKVWIKVCAVATVALFLPTTHVSLVALLGRPKPIRIEWAQRNAPHATVLSAHLQEGKAIYLWLMLEGQEEPRAYVLPWDSRQARRLHQARREARENGTKVEMRRPFASNRDDGPPVFYAPPQPPLPRKAATGEDPIIFLK